MWFVATFSVFDLRCLISDDTKISDFIILLVHSSYYFLFAKKVSTRTAHGTDSACSSLFCAAKRSDAFTPKMGWGLVCQASAVSRGRSPGNSFPHLGPGSLSSRAKRLPADLARPQSWWGGGLHSVTISQKRWSPLVELTNNTNSVKGITKRVVIVQARVASPNIWVASTLFIHEYARCGSKPARWRCRV
jgi:hypothetical protein